MKRGRVGEVVRVEAVRVRTSPPRAARNGRPRRCCRRRAAPADAPQAQRRGRRARIRPPSVRPAPSGGSRSAVGIDRVVAARVDAFEARSAGPGRAGRRRRRRSPRRTPRCRAGRPRRCRDAGGPRACASPCATSARAWLRATMSCWPTVSRIQRASGISLLFGSDSSGQRLSSALTRGSASGDREPLVEVLVVGQRGAQAREAERGGDRVRRRRGRAQRRRAIQTRRSGRAGLEHRPATERDRAEQQQHGRRAHQVAVDHRRAGGALGEEHEHQQGQRRQRRQHAPRARARSRAAGRRSRPASPAACRSAPRTSRSRPPRSRTPACVRVPAPAPRWPSASTAGCR